MGEDWSTVFVDLYNESYKLKDGGVTKLKILIFSQEKEEEWNRVSKVQKDSLDIKSNVSWEVVPIELKYGTIENKKSLLKKIEDVCPSHLLLNFNHECEYGDDFLNKEGGLLHEQTGFYGLKNKGDLTEILTKGKYRLIDSSACVIKGTGTACLDTKKRRKSAGSPDIKDHKFILLKTIDVFRPSEGIYLLSNTAVTRGKWSERVEKLLGNEIPENSYYKILLFCGTHGRPNGKSGYSIRGLRPPGLLDKTVYDQECLNVEAFKRKYQDKYSKLEIVPYNVAELHHSQDTLHEVIRSESPNMIVMDWCYSFNGDMCLDLRSNAVFSQMLLEANMREIGIASDQVRLSEEQKDALKLALDDKVRAIALVGPLGSGKTIVGSEIIKIWMAIWMSRHTDLQIYIIADGRNTGESLGVDEEKGFAKKLVEDLREKYFRNMTDCNGSEIRFWDLTSQEIDKELKAWAGLINFGFNNSNCGDEEDKVKERQTLLRSWIQKITASGKRKALVFFDEVTIEAFITQEERRQYTRNVMECDNLKANWNHVHLDFSDLTDNENVRFVISFSPTYSTKEGCINDAEGAFNNYTFQLKLPETPEAERQKLLNLTNPYRNTWGIQCFIKYHCRKMKLRNYKNFVQLDVKDGLPHPRTLPHPFSFSESNILKDCKSVIYVADESVAEFVLKELKDTREMKELWAQKRLRSEKPITFLWEDGDECTRMPVVYFVDNVVTKLATFIARESNPFNPIESNRTIGTLSNDFVQKYDLVSSHYREYVGKENDVIVFSGVQIPTSDILLCDSVMSRARRLLILIGPDGWMDDYFRNDDDDAKKLFTYFYKSDCDNKILRSDFGVEDHVVGSLISD